MRPCDVDMQTWRGKKQSQKRRHGDIVLTQMNKM